METTDEYYLDASPWDDVLEACDLRKVRIFLINEVEGGQITGKENPEEILDEMERYYPDAQVVLTLGGQGAYGRETDRRSGRSPTGRRFILRRPEIPSPDILLQD